MATRSATSIAGSFLTGPLRMWQKGRVGSGNVKTLGKAATVTVAALTTQTSETYTITDADALVSDVISVSPGVAVETGWGIQKAWVSADGTIKVQAYNYGAGSLTGGSLPIYYTITR